MSLAAILILSEAVLALSFVLGVVAHELGHAAAAWAVRIPVRVITIGHGRALLHWRAPGRPRAPIWIIRAIPNTGYVSVQAGTGFSRAAYAAMLAGGPAANAVLLLFALLAQARIPDPYALFNGIWVSQAVILALTLFPYRAGWSASDGRQLLDLLLRPPSPPFQTNYAALIATVLPPGTMLPEPSPDAVELIWQLTRRDRILDAWGTTDSQQAVRALLEAGRLTPPERAMALGLLSGNAVLFGGTGTTPAELDTWSAEAAALAPCPAMRCNRAAALARLGRAAEAEALLAPLMDAPGNPVERMLRHLAMAEITDRLGRPQERETHMRRYAAAAATARGPQRTLIRAIRRRALIPQPSGA